MKLIVGLGNPGKKYQKNRHNVGFMVVDKIAADKRWGKSKSGLLKYVWLSKDVELVKPQTFMNKSGLAVAYARKGHPDLTTDKIYVIHDDLDITLGEYKIQRGKGPREHGGIESIDSALGTKDYWRVRIGIENREGRVDYQRVSAPLSEPQTPKSASATTPQSTPGSKTVSGEDYVLQNFLPDEQEVVDRVILEVVKELENAYKRRGTA